MYLSPVMHKSYMCKKVIKKCPSCSKGSIMHFFGYISLEKTDSRLYDITLLYVSDW